ncbi:MAG: hypothetical protein FK734_00480 [Asgard group archaeon]|nr:hypothetical protein [Asgard group archaeon]
MNEQIDNLKRLTNHIRICGELACLLEVSATPKPGNVHRFSDFSELRYEDFLASSVSFGIFIEELAEKGYLIAQKKLQWAKLSLGQTIKETIAQSSFFHNHGNTNLGIILLLSPIAVAAGLTINLETMNCEISSLHQSIAEVMKHTTVEDAIAVSEGIQKISPGGMGKVEKYDVTESSFKTELLTDNITLLDLMSQCKHRDNICLELSENYPITFDTAIPAFKRTMILSKDINLAIIDAYLAILANHPDTLVSRKFGFEKALDIADRAKAIIKLGGSLTVDGHRELEELDIELREEEDKINPGTSADLIASTVFIYLLEGGKLWENEIKK